MIPSIAEPRTPRVGPGCSLAARFFLRTPMFFRKDYQDGDVMGFHT